MQNTNNPSPRLIKEASKYQNKEEKDFNSSILGMGSYHNGSLSIKSHHTSLLVESQ